MPRHKPVVVREEIQELGGWVTIQRAADALGVTRQAVSKKIRQGGVPRDQLRRLAYGGHADNDLLIVRVDWVREQLVRAQERAEAKRAKLDAAADEVPQLEPIDEENVRPIG
jgi:hypothetical protein